MTFFFTFDALKLPMTHKNKPHENQTLPSPEVDRAEILGAPTGIRGGRP
ncbi:MAG: hypothetical protein ACRDPY_48895 [Streptosporangiaceae bacterium]